MMLIRPRLSSGLKCIFGLRFSPEVLSKHAPISVDQKMDPMPFIRQFTKSSFNKEREGHSTLFNYNDNSEEEEVNEASKVVEDENEDLYSDRNQIYSDWRNPHQEFVEEILKQLHLESITQSVISEFCSDIENKSDDELVQFFAKVSVHYNDTDTVRDKEPDLSTLINAVIERVGNFSYENLLLSVKALNSWPEAIRTAQLRFEVPSKHHHEIRQLYKALRDDSVLRLSGSFSKPELFISVASAGMPKAFELSDAWLSIDRYRKGWLQSYPVEVVARISNKEKGSLRKMKPMNKDLFVDFMRTCKQVKVLRPNFHKYYCTVKFVDFLPIMNEDEMRVCSQAFVICDLVGDTRHPMELKLKSSLLNFVRDNILTIKSENISSIMGHIQYNMPRILLSDIIDLQKVMVDQGVTERLDVDALISVAGMGVKEDLFGRRGIYPPFMEKVASSILSRNEMHDKFIWIEVMYLKTMAEMTALHCDTPIAREACEKLLENVLSVKDMRGLAPLTVARCLLNMAHLGLYNEEALNWLFTCDRVTKEVRGERLLLGRVKFGDKAGKRQGLGEVINCLQGMVELEFPEYRGALITGELDKLRRYFMHSDTPLNVSEHGPDWMQDRYWIKKGVLLHRILSRLTGGDSFVCESYVFPFTGEINYVILLDDCGRPREIPDWFRSLPETRTKMGGGEGQWVMFTMMHPKHSMLFSLTGGPKALDRMARRAGFNNVTIDSGVMDQLEEIEGTNEEEELVKYVRDKLAASCPIYDSSPADCYSVQV